ncbi:amidophosphoribosyltransferase [Bacteroides stercorirosoris]|uniref:Amidophosphoribosyltransferase n=2 Tax=Bacteroides stercorirosoris TaxID=871324 RepID=A0A1M6JJ25_9BACE|nr:amidophosphoribosyltransferase [Bacteroides stercorirosoris]OKZ10655.1 MAG: amidophosphoribosyltransferase [Bacteroides oleiciplenus]RGX76709.1 amidophosphoribosyltransferase [Bacteroides stercorirosoris]SHJ46717.1 amidophosphoribosyltransferase [Bacteroides stercorirosoris]
MGGFFGTVAKASCVTDLFYGTDYNSHLGTKRGGLATYDAEEGMFARSIHNLESTYFRTKFEDELDKFKGNAGIGIISDTDPQPIIINSHLGRFAIVTVAKIVNLEEIEAELLSKNMHFAELSSGNTNQTELISLLIIQGRNFVEGIENVFRRVKGSCSMLLLSEDGSIIAARDKWGRTPIVIGRKDGAYAATSESSSFPNLDYEIDRYLGPGEIVRMTADGVEQLRKPEEKMQICSFLWVYYGFPTSCYEGRNVEEVRFTSGLKMGQKDASQVDCACGIPDSGVGMALGYAEGKGVPYHRAISKYTPTWPRSFTPSKQEMRSLVAKMKLIPNRAMLKDKRVLFCDDSIVRGTQLRDNVKVLYEYGAKEVHIRIACPPLIYACPFVGFTASKSPLELITRRIIAELEGDPDKNLEKYATTGSPEYEKMVSIIAERFGLTSLKFNTLETLVEAIGLPKCKVCTHCFDGSSCF